MNAPSDEAAARATIAPLPPQKGRARLDSAASPATHTHGIGRLLVGKDGLAEGVEVDDDNVDQVDVVRIDGLLVRLKVAARENAAVHLGVQRLDAA